MPAKVNGFHPDEISKARRALSRRDPTMKIVIQRVGPFTLRTEPGGYEVLVRSILSQQISVAAARTIRTRLQASLPKGKIVARAVDALSDEQLQSVGISSQKRGYLRDLTRCTLEGTINFSRISKASDEDAIGELIQVKGIGRWTAQMFLLFSLGRPDIFAVDDLGLQNAVARLYGYESRPAKNELMELSERWAPWRSVASWYLWRSLDLKTAADEYPV